MSLQKPCTGKLVQKQPDLQLIRSQTFAAPILVGVAPAGLSVFSRLCRKRQGCEALHTFAVCEVTVQVHKRPAQLTSVPGIFGDYAQLWLDNGHPLEYPFTW